MTEKTLETDVFVMGGGLAGCFAAVQAKKGNMDVILADKNYVGKSGCSHFARDFMVFNEDWGDDYETWMKQFTRIGEYIVDHHWVDVILRESYARYLDLISWGFTFYLKDESIGFPEPGVEPKRILCRPTKYRYTTLIAKYGVRNKMLIARKKVKASGCKILDRIMITDIVKKEGRIVGVVGFDTTNGDYYHIKTKAVVIASGGLGFKGAAFGIQFNTGDGLGMGYRAGAAVSSIELGQGMYVVKECDSIVINGPVSEIGRKRDMVFNSEGEEFLRGFPHVPTNILWPLEVHHGRGPLFHQAYGMNRDDYKAELESYNKTAEGPWIKMLDRAGLDVFTKKFEQFMQLKGNFYPGGLRVNTDCETNIPGLYAAGDASGTNYTGPNYAALGCGTASACVTGHRAGQNAAKYAENIENIEINTAASDAKDIVFKPLKRTGGFSPAFILRRLQEIIFPYEVRIIMHEKRLQAALTMIEFFRDHFLPKQYAADPHELRLAQEVVSMLTGAEMMLKGALFRTESRGWFYREDYPERDDKNWLKWVMIRKENETMKIWAEPVPEEFQGDKSLPYEERYPLEYSKLDTKVSLEENEYEYRGERPIF
jgi:succinate dehydrogenase/fumarate reductase flavoprotein subunit